ncbi:1188_t:CDS:2, partial [Gigaspora margarita]
FIGILDIFTDYAIRQISVYSRENKSSISNQELKVEDFVCLISKSINESHLVPYKQITDFLVDMSNESMVYNTIVTFYSEISEIHKFIDGSKEDLHPFVAKVMVTIYKKKSLPSLTEDAIDLIPALNHIMSMGANESILIIQLFRKTVFLLAITSATKSRYTIFNLNTTPQPSAVDAVSNWFKKILTHVDPRPKAKDLKVISAFLEQESGADVDST